MRKLEVIFRVYYHDCNNINNKCKCVLEQPWILMEKAQQLSLDLAQQLSLDLTQQQLYIYISYLLLAMLYGADGGHFGHVNVEGGMRPSLGVRD